MNLSELSCARYYVEDRAAGTAPAECSLLREGDPIRRNLHTVSPSSPFMLACSRVVITSKHGLTQTPRGRSTHTPWGVCLLSREPQLTRLPPSARGQGEDGRGEGRVRGATENALGRPSQRAYLGSEVGVEVVVERSRRRRLLLRLPLAALWHTRSIGGRVVAVGATLGGKV